jgi:hypothetical protein
MKMKFLQFSFSVFLITLLLNGQGKVYAQDTPETPTPTEQTEYQQDESPAISDANSDSEEVEQTPKKKKSFWSKLAFWKKSAPQEEGLKPKIDFNVMSESIWHENLARYMGVTDEEFYRFGYVRKGVQWYPIFFLRRFKMMQNQYEHTLVIHGKPAKLPKVKGLDIGPYGLEVRNEGFEFQMPTVASVSRSQKQYDDARAIEVATIRMQSFGFDQVVWLKDKKRETKDLSDTWSFSTDQK